MENYAVRHVIKELQSYLRSRNRMQYVKDAYKKQSVH